MFQWTVIFALIAVASSFFGMNSTAEFAKELASGALFIGMIFILMSMFGPERKFRSKRA